MTDYGEDVPHTDHCPLTVRLTTSRGTRDVTRDVHDLSFRWTDPGGYASCQTTLDRPLTLQPDEVAAFGRLTVHDARNGEVVWDGRLEEPGRKGGGNDGEVWDIAAIGGRAHATDMPQPLIYVDRSYTDFYRRQEELAGSTDGVEEDANNVTGLALKFPNGLKVIPGSVVTSQYSNLSYAEQRLARLEVTIDSGRTDAEYSWLIGAKTASNSIRTTRSNTITTTAHSEIKYVGTGVDGGLSITHDTVQFQMKSNTANGTIADDTVWTTFSGLVIKATRYNKDGFEISDYTSDGGTINASKVVNDLLGRMLPDYDGEGAVIESTPDDFELGQLAYPDGTTAERVLADLMLYDRYTWRVWEGVPLRGRSGTLGVEDFEDTNYLFYIQTGTWFRTNAGIPIGAWAMRSGAITTGQTSDMIVNVPPGATTLNFEYSVSSEPDFDVFEVLFDGRRRLFASGTVGWTRGTFDVGAVSKVTFRYSKDSSTNVGDDCVYIDNINFSGVPTAEPRYRYRFEWVALPSTVRYEADITDGYTSRGSTDTIFNEVVVRYQDPKGNSRSTRRRAVVPDLEAAGLTRVGELDIGAELSGSVAAARIGDQWLAEHQTPLNAGQLRIARPIRDLETGRMVQPWEIRPGLIRVRGIQPRVDRLNATDRDGVTTFRIVACDYSTSDGAATLELDSPSSNVSRWLAQLEHRPTHVRGRESTVNTGR